MLWFFILFACFVLIALGLGESSVIARVLVFLYKASMLLILLIMAVICT